MKQPEAFQILVEEYIRDIDMSRILNLKIMIPGFKDSISMYTDRQLMGRIEQSPHAELCLVLTMPVQGKKSITLLDKLKSSSSMRDFKFTQPGRAAEFILRTGNDVAFILAWVRSMLAEIFPAVHADMVRFELTRITQWHTLKG